MEQLSKRFEGLDCALTKEFFFYGVNALERCVGGSLREVGDKQVRWKGSLHADAYTLAQRRGGKEASSYLDIPLFLFTCCYLTNQKRGERHTRTHIYQRGKKENPSSPPFSGAV